MTPDLTDSTARPFDRAFFSPRPSACRTCVPDVSSYRAPTLPGCKSLPKIVSLFYRIQLDVCSVLFPSCLQGDLEKEKYSIKRHLPRKEGAFLVFRKVRVVAPEHWGV